MNKSFITNFISLSFILISYFVDDELNKIVFSIGVFALSGSITNWLAVHMLFEKVPLLYGSGVILDRFNEIKKGIKKLALDELFTNDKIEKFLINKKNDSVNSILSKIDFDKLFEGLLDSIESSKLGGMLVMLGGRKALLPLKEPLIGKLKLVVNEKLNDVMSNKSNHSLVSNLRNNIEKAVDSKLEELNPLDIKKIVEQMIKEHLGWLIVWGGVFGGVFGLIFSLIQFY